MAPLTTSEGFLWTPSRSTTGLVTDAVVPSSTAIQDGYDVIVVGAGFAGLVAARDIAISQQLKVLIVEARDRIGGRARDEALLIYFRSQPHAYAEISRYGLYQTLKISAGSTTEAQATYKSARGAAKVVGESKPATSQRIAEKMFTIDGLNSRALMPYPHNPLREPAPWRKYDHLIVRQRLDELTDETQGDRDELETLFNTIGSSLGTETGWAEALRWFVLAGHSLEGLWESVGTFKLGNGGMTSLARRVLDDAGCDILMQTAVKAFEQDRNSVRVITDQGRVLRARYVVSTIPQNVLSSITFSPSLPRLHQEAILQGHINKGSKIHFQLAGKEKPWLVNVNEDCQSSYCFAFSDHNGTSPAASPGQTWCIGFGYTGHLSNTKDSQHVIAEFQKDIKPNADVRAYLTHDWALDPFAKGSWCCWGPGATSKYLEQLQQPHGRILMASGDWANGWRGFVDGAIESGAKAAMAVYRAIETEMDAQPLVTARL